jgi:hypothetical protein
LVGEFGRALLVETWLGAHRGSHRHALGRSDIGRWGVGTAPPVS